MKSKSKKSTFKKDVCEMENKKERNKFTMVVFLFGGIICSLALSDGGVSLLKSISNGFTLSFFVALFAYFTEPDF